MREIGVEQADPHITFPDSLLVTFSSIIENVLLDRCAWLTIRPAAADPPPFIVFRNATR